MSLGANEGDARGALRDAIRALSSLLEGSRHASLYRTSPVSAVPQADYLNTAILGRTSLSARQLLELAHELERHAGRDSRGPRWGPRTLDVDLAWLGTIEINDADLIVPHPRLRDRRFMLEPLAEIAPRHRLGPGQPTLGALCRRLRSDPTQQVSREQGPEWAAW